MTGPDLQAWRARLGLTQARAAALFAVPLVTWKRWERRGPPFPVLLALACAEAERRGIA